MGGGASLTKSTFIHSAPFTPGVYHNTLARIETRTTDSTVSKTGTYDDVLIGKDSYKRQATGKAEGTSKAAVVSETNAWSSVELNDALYVYPAGSSRDLFRLHWDGNAPTAGSGVEKTKN